MNSKGTLVNTILFLMRKAKVFPEPYTTQSPNPLAGIRYTAALDKVSILLVKTM